MNDKPFLIFSLRHRSVPIFDLLLYGSSVCFSILKMMIISYQDVKTDPSGLPHKSQCKDLAKVSP
jgi:hypothetical protein